jgi:predicted AAA+ superfamily ATPase
MRLLLDSVIKRLAGKGGDPVIQLQTAFGGGKTHTMLAVYHLANGGVPHSELQGIPPILDAAGVTDLTKSRVVVIDGNKQAPNQPKIHEGLKVCTLWGELAWQLGGEAGYEFVRAADESGTSPGKDVLAKLLAKYAPCVILVDELVAYLRQFEEGKALTGGTYDSNLSFIQALNEALKAVPNALMLASLPESDKEAGSQRGINALRTLEHYFARVQALWKPVAAEEAFEIVRRRLFAGINDKHAAEAVCRAYADFYIGNSADFPRETQESRYYERLLHAYPIHPEIFARIYEDWSSLDNFQRTRGVLKLMAKVIHRLWKDGNNDLLIMPGSLPLYDPDTRNEAIYYLPQGWDPVLERDIDGERAETTDIENRDTRLGSVQACRRTARTIFLGSAPSTPNHMVRGIEIERVLLGCVQPGQQVGIFKDGLRRLSDKLHFLNSANSRFWFDVRPNLRREMEERKRRFQDKEDVFPAIRDRVQRSFASGIFGGIHVFTSSSDVPDDWHIRLVVLPPDAAFSRTGQNLATERATEILKNRGDQPRQKQNRLIFVAADYDSVSRLKDQVRSVLAWHTIVADIKDLKLNLDQFQARQANKGLEDANEALRRMIRETYKWLLAPVQIASPGKGISEIQWEHFPLNPSAPNLTQEIEHVLKDNELVITDWSPIHLYNLLRSWFWKEGVREANATDVWQKSCYYLYLPRLKDSHVFQYTLAAGAASRDFFGLAYGKEGDKYSGFSFGKPTSPFLDGLLLLIEPVTAASYAEALKSLEKPAEPIAEGETQTGDGGKVTSVQEPAPIGLVSEGAAGKQTKRQFYGSIELDPVRAKFDFANIVDEVVMQFTSRPDVKVRIAIEIHAESSTGFDEGLQRAVKENCNVLKFKTVEFEGSL